MKTIISILLFTSLLPLIGFTQTQPDCCVENDCVKIMTKSPTVQKGYYAIGNNKAKLTGNNTMFRCCKTDNVIVVTRPNQSAQKGYYTITGNQQKLADKKAQYVVVQNPQRVTKGYYAIGSNHEELPQKLALVKKTCRCICG